MTKVNIEPVGWMAISRMGSRLEHIYKHKGNSVMTHRQALCFKNNSGGNVTIFPVIPPTNNPLPIQPEATIHTTMAWAIKDNEDYPDSHSVTVTMGVLRDAVRKVASIRELVGKSLFDSVSDVLANWGISPNLKLAGKLCDAVVQSSYQTAEKSSAIVPEPIVPNLASCVKQRVSGNPHWGFMNGEVDDYDFRLSYWKKELTEPAPQMPESDWCNNESWYEDYSKLDWNLAKAAMAYARKETDLQPVRNARFALYAFVGRITHPPATEESSAVADSEEHSHNIKKAVSLLVNDWIQARQPEDMHRLTKINNSQYVVTVRECPLVTPVPLAPQGVVEELRDAIASFHRISDGRYTTISASLKDEANAALAKLVTLPEPSEWAEEVAEGIEPMVSRAYEDRIDVISALLKANPNPNPTTNKSDENN